MQGFPYMEIDVIMLTKNSNKPWFKRVLSAIKREIPVHHFIVVDGFSSDGTLDVIRNYFKDNVIIVQTKRPLGFARYIGMKLVDTEWFAFIDSDVEILPGWFETARRYISMPRVLGVQGVFTNSNNLYPSRNSDIKAETIKPLRKILRKQLLFHGFYSWGGADTGHVLLHKLVRELIEPCVLAKLHCGEDLYLAQSIIQRGYYYIRVNDMRAIHYGRETLGKATQRLKAENGILLYLNPVDYMLYSWFRMIASLARSQKSSLLYLAALIYSPISYVKTRVLQARCRDHD